ncbi:MAG: hypothetical protein IJ005_07815 [Bacteroidales bacterium]|nr:hypothetical protein [Bacteroidales bacterium]
MKKIALFMSALALLALSSCEEKEGTDLSGDFIEDGFYVIGEAAGTNEVKAEYLMAAGFNEVDKTRRTGMYEKYIALEAGKTFTLALYEAGKITNYGAELTDFDLTGKTDNPGIVIKRGSLISGENAPAMSVAEDGLYHIVLDLNTAKDLNTALIIITPTNWGVRGAMNQWGFTAMDAPAFNKTEMKYSIVCDVPSGGDGFKFASLHGWKIDMDDAGLVKSEIGLGNDATEDNLPLMPNDLVQYGKNIGLAERAQYTITLTWKLAGGDLRKSFTATVEKTGELEAANYTDCQMELVGSGIAVQEGSADDTVWSWGQVLLASNNGKPTADGTVYTWTWNNAQITADGWKIRVLNAAESGGIANFDLGADKIDTTASSVTPTNATGDILIEAGTYNITLTIDAATETRTIVITAAN